MQTYFENKQTSFDFKILFGIEWIMNNDKPSDKSFSDLGFPRLSELQYFFTVSIPQMPQIC